MLVAFYSGRRTPIDERRLFNRVVSWWDNGKFSHTEAVLGVEPDGKAYCGSSSFMDGGVRNKIISLDSEKWTLVDMPQWAVERSKHWFALYAGSEYDVLGILGFVWRPLPEVKTKFYCNEAVGLSQGVVQPWRFTPNSFFALCLSMGGTVVPASEWARYQIVDFNVK